MANPGYEKLMDIQIVGELQIHCRFTDGSEGRIDFRDWPPREGVFRKLDEPGFFATARVENGVLVWNGGALDIAPETLYHRATGNPLPDWMEK